MPVASRDVVPRLYTATGRVCTGIGAAIGVLVVRLLAVVVVTMVVVVAMNVPVCGVVVVMRLAGRKPVLAVDVNVLAARVVVKVGSDPRARDAAGEKN